MIRIGPFTIMRTKTLSTYERLAAATWALHREIWFTQNPPEVGTWPDIMRLDGEVADALSRIPEQEGVRSALVAAHAERSTSTRPAE